MWHMSQNDSWLSIKPLLLLLMIWQGHQVTPVTVSQPKLLYEPSDLSLFPCRDTCISCHSNRAESCLHKTKHLIPPRNWIGLWLVGWSLFFCGDLKNIPRISHTLKTGSFHDANFVIRGSTRGCHDDDFVVTGCTRGCHDANFVISSSTRGCHYDNIRCCHWWQSWHYDMVHILLCFVVVWFLKITYDHQLIFDALATFSILLTNKNSRDNTETAKSEGTIKLICHWRQQLNISLQCSTH